MSHLYNTTQKILVNGHGYVKFIEEFLVPYCESKVPLYEEEIVRHNNLVLDTLGGKKVKRSDVKYRQGTSFQCLKCDFTAKTCGGLEKHKKKDHAISFLATSITSTSSLIDIPANIITLTRDNSFIQILNEDISELNLLDDRTDLNAKDVIEEIVLPASSNKEEINPKQQESTFEERQPVPVRNVTWQPPGKVKWTLM